MRTPQRTSFLTLFFLLSLICSISLTPNVATAGDQETWNQLTEKANTLFNQERYDEAIRFAIKSLEHAERRFGAKSARTLSSSLTLASFFHTLGDLDQAIPLFQRSLRLSRQLKGKNHPDSVKVMADLAQALGERGDYEKARPLLEKALSLSQKNPGANNSDTLSLQTNLARVYEALGLFAQAEKLLIKTVATYRDILGDEAPETLQARENLASVYKSEGKYEETETILEEVRRLRIATQGENKIETAITTSDLADVLRRRGSFEESETLFLRAIDIFLNISDENDPDLSMTRGNLAQLYQDTGKYGKAKKLFLQVWEYDKSSLGKKHPNSIIDQNNLAGIYRLLGEYGLAEKNYIEALNDIREVLGEKHPETISVMNNLGLLFENEGLFDKSEPLYKMALNVAKETLGATHPTTLALMNNLASLYESQGVFDKSESLYLNAITLYQNLYGPNNTNAIASVNNLGYLYMMRKQYAKAEPLFAKVYHIWSNQLGATHQKTLKSLNNLGRVSLKLGKTDQADTMISEALRIRKETLGGKHPDVVRSMIDLATVYLAKKEYPEAERLLKKTLALSEEILGERHQYTFETLNALIDLYEKTGNLEEALRISKIGFDRRTQFFDQVLWAAGENTRQSYIDLHKHEQDRFLTLLVKLNNRDSAKLALHSSLQRKGLLLKITSEIHRIVEMSNSPDLASQAKKIHEKRKRLASLTLSGPTTETPLEFKKKLVQLEDELEELQAEIGRTSQIFHITSKRVDVDDVFKNLEPADVLVDFITYTDKTPKMIAVVAQTNLQSCFVWWKCLGNQINFVPLGELDKINETVAIYRETIQDEDSEEEDIIETGRDVYQLIWKPLTPFIKEKTSIYIVPDSALHLLPFDAIVDENDNYLIESLDLKIMSSSRDLVVSTLPDAKGSFMILAGPDYNLDNAKLKEKKRVIEGKRGGIARGMRIASHGLRSLSFEPLLGAEIEGQSIKKVSDTFQPLKGAEDEGKSIKKVADGNPNSSIIYLKREAEERQLRQLGKSPKMVHIATHGFFLQAEERLKKRLLSLQRGGTLTTPPPGDNPLLRAGLAFAGINSNAPFLGEIDTDNDGVLTAMEVLSLNLSGTQLVVLSACETGVGEIHDGEGVYGLRRAFQEAGVKSVVASLWPVSDEGTRRLMTAFYKNIFKGMPIRKALKAAQTNLIQSEWSSPYYWSAFVLVERRFSSAH